MTNAPGPRGGLHSHAFWTVAANYAGLFFNTNLSWPFESFWILLSDSYADRRLLSAPKLQYGEPPLSRMRVHISILCEKVRLWLRPLPAPFSRTDVIPFFLI